MCHVTDHISILIGHLPNSNQVIPNIKMQVTIATAVMQLTDLTGLN